MSSFAFEGRSAEGQRVSGTLEAVSKDAVAGQLSSRGITPINIQPAKPKSEVDQWWLKVSGQEKVRTEDLIMLTRQLYTITKAGIPLIRGLRGLAASMAHPKLRRVLESLAAELETGVQLSTAMLQHRDVFDNLYINMVKVGEDAGQLEAIFDQLSTYLEKDLDTKKRITSAMRYPSFVLIALVIALAVVNVMVIPAFADMFASFDAELPLATKILLATSSFFVNYWPYMLVASITAWQGFKYYIKTPDGSFWWGANRLRLPIVGDIITRALMARYARSFGLMLKSGVPLTQALDLCSKAIDNAYLANKIQAIRQGIERGDSLLRTHNQANMFTPLVLQMIAVGEESGQVETLLEEVAGFYEREVDYDLKNISDKIEPIMIVVMAGFVMVLALGIFLPMWNMHSIQQ